MIFSQRFRKILFVLVAVVSAISASGAQALPSTALKQINEITNSIAAKIPTGSRIAIKSLSSETTGLPFEFLSRIVSEVESGILRNSNYALEVIDRSNLESVWEDAVEFNNTKIESLASSANADFLLVISPSLTQSDVTLAISVYHLTPPDTGKTAASSGVQPLGINIEKELGVNLVTMNQQVSGIEQQLSDLEAMLKTDDLSEGNQISRIFYEFATEKSEMKSVLSLFRAFKDCDKPREFEKSTRKNEVGRTFSSYDRFILNEEKIIKAFSTKCEVWNGVELVLGDNMEFETKIDLIAALENRNSVGELILDSHLPNTITVPFEIAPFITKSFCATSGGASNQDYVFEVTFPEKESFYVNSTFRGGSGGTWGQVNLFRDKATFNSLISKKDYSSEDWYRECKFVKTDWGGYWD